MPHLDNIAHATERVREHDRQAKQERARLVDAQRQAIRRARADGVTFSAIAARTGLSREWIRKLAAGD